MRIINYIALCLVVLLASTCIHPGESNIRYNISKEMLDNLLVNYNESTEKWYLLAELKKENKTDFFNLTNSNIGKNICIYVDSKKTYCTKIQLGIDSGELIVAYFDSKNDAVYFANKYFLDEPGQL